MDMNSLSIGIRAPHMWAISCNVIFWIITSFIGRKFGTRSGLVKNRFYMVNLAQNVVVNEWRARIASISISKQ